MTADAGAPRERCAILTNGEAELVLALSQTVRAMATDKARVFGQNWWRQRFPARAHARAMRLVVWACYVVESQRHAPEWSPSDPGGFIARLVLAIAKREGLGSEYDVRDLHQRLVRLVNEMLHKGCGPNAKPDEGYADYHTGLVTVCTEQFPDVASFMLWDVALLGLPQLIVEMHDVAVSSIESQRSNGAS